MVFPTQSTSLERVAILGTIDLKKDDVTVDEVDPVHLLALRPSEVLDFYIKKSTNNWLRSIVIGKPDLTEAVHRASLLYAYINGCKSMVEIGAEGGVVLKADSLIKSGQSALSKVAPRRRNVGPEWQIARSLITSLMATRQITKERGKKDIWRLKSDLELSSLELATLLVSGMDARVSPNIWNP